MYKVTWIIKLFLSVALPAICVCNVTAQTHGLPSRENMKTADSLYFARDWSKARAIYIKVMGDTSRNGIAWNRLGFAEYNSGNYEAAAKAYQRALQLKPGPPLKASAYSRLARINALENKNETAYADIDSAITAGYNAFPELDTVKDFARIRSTVRFKQLRAKTYNTAFPCMVNMKAREFDFWVGEWNVFVTGTKIVAGHSVIQIIAGGCAILENWTSNNSLNNGKSINFIDPVTNKWKQSWAGGGNQEFVNGEYKDGAMRFTFETAGPQNQKLMGRFIFFNEAPGKVRQFDETSADNGKTWTTSYDFTYIRMGDSKADM